MSGRMIWVDFEDPSKPVVIESNSLVPVSKPELLSLRDIVDLVESCYEMFEAGEDINKIKLAAIDFYFDRRRDPDEDESEPDKIG
jgi:hypothetical protein